MLVKKDNAFYRLSLLIFVSVLLLIQSFSGCMDLDDTLNFFDKELRRADPYLNKIVFNDETLRSYALSICKNCKRGDKESVITTLYRHIVEQFTYIPDPIDEELIRSPQQTIKMKGGDCEDLSILLMSLLENLNIKTYLVLTDEHAYALAYDVNISNLWQYVEQELIQQVEQDSGESLWQTHHETFTLKRKQVWYYGGEGTSLDESDSFDYINISYNITSTKQIDMYIVPSKEAFNKYTDNKNFTYYEKHQYSKETQMKGTCGYMKTHGGVILSNSNWLNNEVFVNLTFYSHPSFYKLFENNSIRSYMIQEKQSIVLEPTAGAYGYPGYDANVTGKKTAIDPITKDYFFLE